MLSPPTTSQQFLEMVVQSGLLSEESLRPYFHLAAANKPDAQMDLANLLVKDRLLTPFQGRQILAGRFRGYFLGDKYKVLTLIGSGGTGQVVLCEHLVLQRLVAVKLLQHAAAEMTQGGQAAAVERFVREARAVATLDHANIVRIHDMELTGEIPFMVMEYVDGSSLHQVAAQSGPLPVERAVDYLTQAANGLQHAHENGLIHRDIKPGNLLLERTGVVKVLDLGLARFLRDTPRNEDVSARYNDQSVVGTVDFMSPEQAMNSPSVDIRSDIYSLGATFYYLLAGRAPFEGESISKKLIFLQLHEPTPIRSIRSDIPADLAALMSRMMAKNPIDRYQTPAETVAALAPWTRKTIPPPSAAEMPHHPPASYRLGLSPRPSQSTTGSSHPGQVIWEPPHTRDILSSNSEGALPGPASKSIPSSSPAPTAPISNADTQPESTRTNPRTTRSNKPVLIGIAAGLTILLAGLAWFWPTLSGRHDPNTSSNSGPMPSDPGPVPSLSSGVTISGSGSTAIKQAMAHWTQLYEQNVGVKIKYDAIGSGRGVDNMIDKVLDFGCTDAYLTDAQIAKAKPNGEVIHIPLVMGAVVPIYNLPDVSKQLRFTGSVLADIYLGRITNWNHESMRANNPGANLPPDLNITVVRRSDSSGSTSIWTDYLSKISLQWKEKVKSGNTVKWPEIPGGEDVEKSDGVAKAVSAKKGAIGYVELSYALERNLKFAQVQNSTDRWVNPSLQSVTAAANASLDAIPADLRYALIDRPGEHSYPIAGSTWVVMYRNQPGAKGKELVKFLHWAVHEGQEHLADMRYAPLPPKLVQRIDEKIASIQTGN